MVTNISARAPISREQLTDSGDGAERRKQSDWKRGSIRSLKMNNFLVYKDAKAIFGPRLNMVVGPNGSGKSTLVCAIALGLGASPKVLGRADNLSSFVMHTATTDASITVELHMDQGSHLHITRTFSRKDNHSKWFINGRPYSAKEVERKVASLGIQVDNLCTMLPQDKVGDFSGFTPDKLLIETEKALSNDALFRPHMKLIDLQESRGKTQAEEETMEGKLSSMQSELSTLETDVQRYEERKEKEEKLDLFIKRKVWLDVEHYRELGMESKAQLKTAENELKIAKQSDQPLQDELRKWERQDAKMRGIEKSRNDQKSEIERKLGNKISKIESIEGKARDATSEITNFETRRVKKEEKVAAQKSALERHREKLEGLQEKAAGHARLEDIAAAISAKSDEVGDAKADLNDKERMIKDTKMRIAETDARMRALTNQAAVRERKYRARFREEGKVGLDVRNWAARNREQLKGPVVGPIGLEVTVNDSEAATAVETHIPRYIWCSVVVNCKEDHDTILRAFSNQRVSLSVLVNQGGQLRPFQSPFSPAEMANLKETAGVRGFLDDFIDCPDTVRQVLRRNQRINMVFLGSAKTQQVIANDPEFLPRLGKRGPNGAPTGSAIYAGGSFGAPPGSRNIEPLQVYVTKISLYGARKPSVRVSETRSAQVLGPGLDSDAIAAQEEEKAGLEGVLAAAEEKRKRLAEMFSALDQKCKKLKMEHSNLSAVHTQLKQEAGRIKTLEASIAELEKYLAEGVESEKAKLKKRLENILDQHAKSVAAAQEDASTVLDISLEAMAATFTRRMAAEKVAEANDALRNAQESRQELEGKVARLKQDTKKLLNKFNAEKQKAMQKAPLWVNGDSTRPSEFGKKYAELPSKREEVDAVIEDLEEDLSGSVSNPQVVQKYNQLKAETEAVSKSLSVLQAENADAERVLDSIRLPWKEKLDYAVEKLNNLFSEYMSKMDGCYGEVRLADDDSYKKWGIEIKVRFRAEADGGKVAVLNKLVHSGGERSVSTILFLMALQDLQHSPFRVVDEINQGMDPNNERRVFSRIVLNSCGPNRKQYFLITPKLLQGLVAMDNEDMTVIVIMNGPRCITGTDDHTMQKFIAAKKRQLALGAGDAGGSSPAQRRRVA